MTIRQILKTLTPMGWLSLIAASFIGLASMWLFVVVMFLIGGN